MDKFQEEEWLEAQKIPISTDLVAAATRQLQFLAAVDRNRNLYEGPILERAIYRYQACWLPLLAKYGESLIMEGPLVVPLDCEWIWHCHRLNPVQYKSDCQTFYGLILDNQNVASVTQDVSQQETVKIWTKLYPDEPYVLNLHRVTPENYEKLAGAVEIRYDFVSAVKRQSSFFYQVSRPHVSNSRFLEEAVGRYKGFLHLIKRNKENSLKRFCVPTYDVDLIWHSHQLQPVSYCQDLIELHGKVLEHDDTDSDRGKGQKLDTGFSETTRQWEETFGLRYWRAGAMYRCLAPSPVSDRSWPFSYDKKSDNSSSTDGKQLHLTKTKSLELCIEIVGVRNLPVEQKGSFYVSVSKSRPDEFFNGSKKMTIFSETKEKQVFIFPCECFGELIFNLVYHSSTGSSLSKAPRIVGTTSLSLEDLVQQNFRYSVDKWFELMTAKFDHIDSEPISLRIAMSFTPPAIAPFNFKMINARPFSKTACFFPLTRRAANLKDWTCVVDHIGREIINIQTRNVEKTKSKKQLIGIFDHSAEKHTLAELSDSEWSFVDSSWVLRIERDSDKKRCTVDLRGDPSVKLFHGRKLDFEQKYCNNSKNESDFVTLVGFSAEYPYGKALAMLNLKNYFLIVNDESFVFRGIMLAYLLFDLAKREGINRITIKERDIVEEILTVRGIDDSLEVQPGSKPCTGNCACVKGGGCGGCGGGCGGCGGGGGCGNKLEAGGCGGCGGGCGGCGGGCGNMVKSGGCGGCGGGGSGCGGGCGGGLGANAKHSKPNAASIP